MKVFAISDLHLSGEPPYKPMDVFGAHWANHAAKVQEAWLAQVTDEDVVIIAGDISWAMNLPEAAQDLRWLAALPGKKLLLRGNHDYWWASLAKMQKEWPDFIFLQNDACAIFGDLAICGTRGWLLPSAESFDAEDEKIYKREGIRLELALKAAQKQGAKQIIVGMHYPPLFQAEEQTVFTQLMEAYGVTHCVYGHIHGENNVSTFQGERAGVNYKLVSCDTQGFKLTKIR